MARSGRLSLCAATAVLFLACGCLSSALADPPGWAPAYGYRAKHGHRHRDSDRDRVTRRDDDDHERAAVAIPYGINLGRCNRQQIGEVLGGIAGAVAGSTVRGDGRPVAMIGGAILGVLIGGHIGHAMDQADESCVGETLEYAKAGQTVTWNNPDTDTAYRVTPQAAIRAPDGEYCREYQTTIIVEGKEQQAYGKACRQPDGSWKRVD